MGSVWSQDEADQAEASQKSQRETPKETAPPPPKSEVNCKAKLPFNYEAIIKDSDSTLYTSSSNKLYEQLQYGIFLNGMRKKYWVDNAGNNCFTIFVNDLSITWGGDKRYWHWHNMETDHGPIDVAELLNVCWLEVHGRFNTENLSPNVTYEVAYWIMLTENAYGWEVPVNFRLKVLGNGSKQEHKEYLKEKQKAQWIKLPVGEVMGNVGEIEFSLFECEGRHWKRGLILKGVTILPKHNSDRPYQYWWCVD